MNNKKYFEIILKNEFNKKNTYTAISNIIEENNNVKQATIDALNGAYNYYLKEASIEEKKRYELIFSEIILSVIDYCNYDLSTAIKYIYYYYITDQMLEEFKNIYNEKDALESTLIYVKEMFNKYLKRDDLSEEMKDFIHQNNIKNIDDFCTECKYNIYKIKMKNFFNMMVKYRFNTNEITKLLENSYYNYDDIFERVQKYYNLITNILQNN